MLGANDGDVTAGSNWRSGSWRWEELVEEGGLGEGWRLEGGCIWSGLSGVWLVAERSPPRVEDWMETCEGFI